MQAYIGLVYLFSAVLFILGIRRLTHPRTAASGNLLAAVGMLVAVVATLLDQQVLSFTLIAASMAVGALVGGVAAYRVKMTSMPQMVAIFNGFGGGASALVAAAELLNHNETGAVAPLEQSIPIGIGVVIGAVTFTGSFVAFGKLEGLIRGAPITFPLQQAFNALLAAGCVALVVLVVLQPLQIELFWVLLGLACLLGVLLVIPIGGADMPVVVALLNSYSGLAACATGFAVQNQVLIISGSLVGASGLILTNIMCKAMNRSLFNVMFGAVGGDGGTGEAVTGTYKSGGTDEVAMILDVARSVVIVPGYGLAVAQAQHALRELTNILAARGAEVKFAIHPVAGRMPGHMNVLLAEADVPYEQLYEPDDVNPQLPNTDVTLVIGANDVVNPAARSDATSPLYGMPIIDVDKARTTIVIKRSMSPGFSGVQNPLFFLDRTLMYFGDAKKNCEDLVRELKDLS